MANFRLITTTVLEPIYYFLYFPEARKPKVESPFFPIGKGTFCKQNELSTTFLSYHGHRNLDRQTGEHTIRKKISSYFFTYL